MRHKRISVSGTKQSRERAKEELLSSVYHEGFDTVEFKVRKWLGRFRNGGDEEV
jgi:hypothetical protein